MTNIDGDRIDISLIVPALNEEGNLRDLVSRILAVVTLHNLNAEILIVDDCSTDGTLREAQELQEEFPQVRALHKELPHGLGLGVRHGIEHSRGRMGVVVMADGVDPIETILDFKRAVLDEGANLVLLSRYLGTGDADSIPWSYKSFQYLFRWITYLIVGLRFKDTTYAYRAFDIDFVRKMNLKSTGFEISPELTFGVHLSGGRIAEVRGRQTRRIKGVSKFAFRKALFGYGRILLIAFLKRISRRSW